VILLSVLAIISFATAEDTSDYVGGGLMVVVVLLGVPLRFIQEARADTAEGNASSDGDGGQGRGSEREIPLAELVPGNIVKLAAGDMIPADVRILTCKTYFLSRRVLRVSRFRSRSSMPLKH
jgi:P-type Mg2+ transporter